MYRSVTPSIPYQEEEPSSPSAWKVLETSPMPSVPHDVLTLIVDPEATAPWGSWALEMQEQSVGWTPEDLSFSEHGGIGQEPGRQAWGAPASQDQELFLS